MAGRNERPTIPAPQLGSVLGSREYSNAGAVARRLKQRETKGILLTAEHAADQSFPISCDPVTSGVLTHFKVVYREYRPGRKAGHSLSANLLFLSLYRATDRSPPRYRD